MRKLFTNFDNHSGLDTILEVPVPDEMFDSKPNSWHAMKSWLNPRTRGRSSGKLKGSANSEVQLLLGVAGAPLIPLPLQSEGLASLSIKDRPLEATMAKYIVEQYVAATGGHTSLNSVKSMYAIGKVRMRMLPPNSQENETHAGRNSVGYGKGSGGEVGGFVLWQKNPDLWCLEMVVAGCKISAGSDGKVGWRQTPWHSSHASRGPPRPLRRSLQGLDPKSTAMLFSNSVCVGEKPVDGEDCFILKFEAEPSSLKCRSSDHVELIQHKVWGYFSQRTGLLVQLQDSHLLRIMAPLGGESTYWETTMQSTIQDYRLVDGILIAHRGRTEVSLFRFGESSTNHCVTRMEESWTIQEMDFNVYGLSVECFLPPSDLRKEEQEACDPALPDPIHGTGSKSSSPRDVFSGANQESDSEEDDDG